MCSCVRVFSKGLGTRSFFWGRGWGGRWVGGCLFFLSHTWSARSARASFDAATACHLYALQTPVQCEACALPLSNPEGGLNAER